MTVHPSLRTTRAGEHSAPQAAAARPAETTVRKPAGADRTQPIAAEADRTQPIAAEADRTQQLAAPGTAGAFQRGVAAVPEYREPEPTVSFETGPAPGRIVTSGDLKRPHQPLRVRLRRLKVGGRWSVAGLVFLVFCWGLWTASSIHGDHASATLALVLAVVVAVGLFALSRMIGRVVLEQWLGRTRRSAWASHLAIGVFLVAVGFAYLRTVDWIVDAWNFLRGVG